MRKFKAWIIHKFGGYTKEEVNFIGNQTQKIVVNTPRIDKFRVSRVVHDYECVCESEAEAFAAMDLSHQIGDFIVKNGLYTKEVRDNFTGCIEYIFTVCVVTDGICQNDGRW